MTAMDLRPLSVGEILDRTFSLYRRYFLLFIGIAGIPRLLVLALQLPRIWLSQDATRLSATTLTGALFSVVLAVVSVVAYLFSQGGSVIAISEIYLGRSITTGEALNRVRGHLGFLFGVVMLNGLAVLGGAILLIIPGIYVFCRLLVCVPAALIEERGPRDSLTRSWELTRDFAGRSFLIALLYAIIAIAAGALLVSPFNFGMLLSLKNPSSLRIWLALTSLSAQIATILTQPILLIATAIFYYDLRVRKEAFDLQLMMNPTGPMPTGPGSVPSIL